MRCRILCAGLLASVAAGTGAALAADIAVRPGVAPGVAPIGVMPAYISEWAGFYVGIHGGGGWGHKSFQPGYVDTTFPSFSPPDASPKGGVFGFQAGYNWQWGSVVGGLEIDYSIADLSDTTNFAILGFPDIFTSENKIDRLGSSRFRLGYLIFPNWLLYGTAGLGWAHQRLTTTDFFPPTGFSATETSFADEFGWVAGAGVEWKFADHWLLRGEWLHYDFGEVNQFDVVPTFTGPQPHTPDNVRTTVDVARAALSYKF